MSIPLQTSASATFDASGRGIAQLSPAVMGSEWHVKRLIVSATSACQFSVYKNVVSASALTDYTKSGAGDVSETDIHLQALDSLIFVWTNGTPGAIGTVVINGDLETGR